MKWRLHWAIRPVPRDGLTTGLSRRLAFGFVKVGQRAEVKVETFPFTRYGMLTGTVRFVSQDAVHDEKRGLIFHARIKLDQGVIRVDERDVTLSPGMAVSAEISTGERRVVEFFLDPIRTTINEGLRER